MISFGEMRARVSVRNVGNRRFVCARTAAVEEADGNLRLDFDVGERDLLAFHRLLRRLPSAERCRSDGYEELGCLPAGRRARGKGNEANRNEGRLRAKLRTRLSRMGGATSGCSEKLETLANSLALAWLREYLI